MSINLMTELLTTGKPPFTHRDPAERLEAMWAVSADRWFDKDAVERLKANTSDEQYSAKIDRYLEKCGYTIKRFTLPGSPLDRYGHKNASDWTVFEYKLVHNTLAHCCNGPAHGLFITDAKHENLIAALRAGFKYTYLVYLVLADDETKYDLYMFNKYALSKVTQAKLNNRHGISIDPTLYEYKPRTTITL